MSRFAQHPFWFQVAPSAGEVAEYITRAMRLVGRVHGGGALPFSSLGGSALDAFIGLQQIGVPSKRAWARAPSSPDWSPDAPGVLKRVGLPCLERDPHGPRGIDQVFLRMVVPQGFDELAEGVRQVLWAVPPGRCPGPEEASALFVVATFEALFRAGERAAAGLDKLRPLLPVRRGLRMALASLFPEDVLEEFRRTCQSMLLLLPREQPFVYNPQWPGLGRLAASDGDFIAGQTLYEVKCVDPREASLSREYLFQLLGYACLNACAPHGRTIKALGILNPRAGFAWSMGLEAFCRAIGVGSFDAVLKHVREETAVR